MTIVGTLNWPSTVATDASQLYSKNVQTLLEYFIKDATIDARHDRRDHRGNDAGARRHDRPQADARRTREREGKRIVTDHLLTEITVFILAVFVGIEVIGRVPSTLHTPLMSATNAIHGIVLVGAILVAGLQFAPLGPVVGFILIVLASLNVFGGYTVTERMLAMFRPRPVVAKKDD